MSDTLTLIVVIAIGYLLGSIPFGLLLTRAAGLGDIRAIGSGNIGATNVLRTGKRGLAAGTLLLDGLKGAAAVLLGLQVGGDLAGVLGGFAAVVGHMFPLWLGFRGGKGVATGLGVLIAAMPAAGLLAGAVWIAMAYFFRMSSLASLTAFALAPILAAATGAGGLRVGLAGAIAVLVFQRHHANIARLFSGTEPRIGTKA